MQRSPYSRETTDISDQELRQILESENISGLPAPYCLVPHYDGQVPLPPNTLWPAPAQSQRPQSAAQTTGPAPASTGRQGSANASSTSGPGSQRTSSTASGTGEVTRRRTRTTLTPYQLRVLFRVWERTQYPSSDLRFRLATNLMMTPRNVQIWFQNQRQKTKERAEMRRRTHSPSSQAASIQRQPSRPHHQHPPHLPLSSSVGHPATIPGMSPPESPFRYTHGPPPPPPAISTPPQHYMGASSLPSRHAMHYYEASQNPPPASGAHTMASPPTLYPPGIAHHHHHQQHYPPHSLAASHRQSQPLHTLPPPPHAQRGFPSQPLHHHQRHASQPHAMHYEDRSAALSAFTPSDRSLSERGSECTQTSRILPPPAPAAVTLTAEQHRAQVRSTPSPLASGMSSLSVESPRPALRAVAPADHEQLASRGVQLAEILNPVAAAAGSAAASSSDKSAAASDSEAKPSDCQTGPLPSLGTVLANVQSGAGNADAPPKEGCASAVPVSLGSPEAAPAATAGDKWRPW
ncbi:hypothetical protein IWW52_003967 [Coemansia sp. RSA 2704]|nr:hypothetical protein IWW52_003967 [Coemansia sp. RSA 2704]